jgi:hypothetical protein
MRSGGINTKQSCLNIRLKPMSTWMNQHVTGTHQIGRMHGHQLGIVLVATIILFEESGEYIWHEYL